jgi:hypothetical protein
VNWGKNIHATGPHNLFRNAPPQILPQRYHKNLKTATFFFRIGLIIRQDMEQSELTELGVFLVIFQE